MKALTSLIYKAAEDRFKHALRRLQCCNVRLLSSNLPVVLAQSEQSGSSPVVVSRAQKYLQSLLEVAGA